MPTRLDTAEFERSRTWLHEIALAVLPAGTAWVEEADGDRKYDNSGALIVNIQKNCWYSWGAVIGGYSPLRLICFLKPEYSQDEAWAWLGAFLENHPGTGSGAASDVADDGDGVADDARARASAATARELLDRMVDISGTAAEAYLKSRGLLASPPPVGLLGFVPDARLGEGGLISVLTAHERTVGIVVTYVTPVGRKSTVLPPRRRFNLERAPGAVFRLPAPPEALTGPIDRTADYAAAEGVEDALSLWELGKAWTIIGLPGIAALQHVELPKGSRLTVVKDGDGFDSPATRGLIAGVDSQLLNGVRVKVTPTELGADANSVLIEGGVDALGALVGQAAEATLSFDGRIRRLSTLEGLAFDRERAAIRTVFKASAGTIDSEVKKLRPRAAAAKGDGAEEPPISIADDPPWIDPVPALAAILDEICRQIHRYVVVTEHQANAVALWVVASHLVHSTKIKLELFPHLAIQSKDVGAGKSTLLTLVWNGLPRAKLWTYPSGAYLVRVIEKRTPSLCLDELQYAEDRNLLRVIDASHLRRLAFVPILVPDKNGAYLPREFCVWTPLALARLGEFSAAQQSRSVVIWMLPKLASETRERLRRVELPELADCRRQLAAWADTVTTWTPPPLPKTLANRDGDNWEPMLGVAAVAGGDWPKRAQAAAEASIQTERTPSVIVRLLRSIWEIYQPKDADTPATFKSTEALLADLVALPDEDWATMGPAGRSITAAWLRERLTHLLDPPGSTREERGGPRGYAFRQFRNSFSRYIGNHPSLDSPVIDSPIGSVDSSGSSGVTGAKPEDPSKPAGSPVPDEIPEAAFVPDEHSAAKSAEPSKTAKGAAGAPDGPDEPDEPDETREPIEESKSAPKPTEAPRKRRVGRIETVILATRKANPDWSIAQIAKRVGRGPSVVKRVLEDGGAP